ncbi:hypothetical protein RFI_30930 [Reticulomyxa filosa]|uniref:Uncharacterized protein n=1 Tax=Reticulomyxa filosa TaxID=46433 RepID=X6LZ95_RETFI|nr:hypothetical protein RFI_30930 [Reticulomyxa filosa]|eukprot:ETO06462.1 hypothetical protein RFI_30930 [Reticulomyxa filosa]
MNLRKCEWISSRDTPPPTAFNLIPHNTTFNTSIVSVPIGDDNFKQEQMEKKSKELDTQLNNLNKLQHYQSSLLLLRHSLNISKANYFLRASFADPRHRWAFKFDNKIRSCMETIIGRPLTDSNWQQCQLPLKYGGFGLRTIGNYASASFIASVTAATPIISTIHRNTNISQWTDTQELDNAIAHYNSLTKEAHNIRSITTIPTQASLSKSISINATHTFTSNANHRTRAMLTALSTKHSSAFLQAPPNKYSRTMLDNIEFQTITRLRLSLVVSVDEKCHGGGSCEHKMDQHGDHALTCIHGKGRIARHDKVVACITNILKRAELHHRRELKIDANNNERPGDFGLKWFDDPNDLTLFDVGITHAHIANNYTNELHAEEQYYDRKNNKSLQKCIDQGISYVPLIAETTGGWHKVAIEFFNKVAKTLADKENRTEQNARKTIFQKVSVALQKANAISIWSHCR